jgi:hypothetical protein
MTPHEMVEASARLGWQRDGAPSARADAQTYDESGFPIRRGRAGLAARVRRLLSG